MITKRCYELLDKGLSNTEVRDILLQEYGVIHDVAKTKYKRKKRKVIKEQNTIVWSDVHIPFNHPRYLEFLQDTASKYSCTKSVCLGDLIDNHALSRHQSEPDSMGALAEFMETRDEVKKFIKAFPNTKFCDGNHDNIPERQAATLGIPKVFLKDFFDLWGLPSTWEVKLAHIIDGVLYKHGLNCGGKDGAINTAIQEQMSTCIGHFHAFGGVKYIANHRNLIFGMNVGCGIDIEAYAFAYGKHSKYRPTLGCGVVFSDKNAIFVPMDMEKYKRED